MILGSVYLSPKTLSGTVHMVVARGKREFHCMPNIPIGRWIMREDVTEPTCPECLIQWKKDHG